jgi:L-ribulose-5-phosphate 3-epimerase
MSRFTLSAFGDEISPDLDEQIQGLKANDIHYLECRGVAGQVIIDYPLPQVQAIYHQLNGEGISVSAIGSPIGKVSISDDFAPHLDRFRKTIEVAHALHTANIRMFSFYLPEHQPPAEYRQAVLDRWGQFIEAANGANVLLLHENEHAIYGDTAVRCLDLLDSLACPYVKATFDPANFILDGEETYPYAFELLKKHIAYLHIKDAIYADHRIVPAGQGDGHLADILMALHHSGFAGFLSIEPHLNENLPGGGPGRFKIASDALKLILKQVTDHNPDLID